jgi:catechol 2,3-dioxygenase-like lactoylglutathione lyase family enzyme
VFDHVGIAVSDIAASERFYRTVLSVLGVEPSHADAELVEWDDWAIGPTDREHPVTRGLHVGFRARDRAQVDAFWQAGVDAGYRDDGAPGPRTQYGPTYYGAFLLDPDGNSVEAVHGDREDAVPDGSIDHLWIRVRDPQASRRFYTTIAAYAGLRLAHDEPGRVQLSGTDYSFSLVRDRAAAHGARPPRVPRARGRHGTRVPRRRARGGLRGPRRAGRARGLPPGLLRCVRARPRRAQRRGRQPQPGLSRGRRVRPPHLGRGPRGARPRGTSDNDSERIPSGQGNS